MLSPDLEAALNQQVNREFFSSYLYLQMAAHFDRANLAGFGKWMRTQASEEYLHALRFFDHILQRGGEVRLADISAPGQEFGSPLEVFEQALDHERSITRAIEELFSITDQPTRPLLQWFSTEQIEEEQTLGHIVESLRLAGADGPALLLLDRELGARNPGTEV
jgi:ferritin